MLVWFQRMDSARTSPLIATSTSKISRVAFFEVARLSYQYLGFLILAIPQLEPHNRLNIAFEYGI